jgi:hypothetical protein
VSTHLPTRLFSIKPFSYSHLFKQLKLLKKPIQMEILTQVPACFTPALPAVAQAPGPFFVKILQLKPTLLPPTGLSSGTIGF